MNESTADVIEHASSAFGGAVGPASFRYPESGWWYEWGGKEIAKTLLALDPEDLEYDEIISPYDSSFVPAWTTGEGLMWLVPGVIRVCFAATPERGDALLQRLFGDIHDRISKGEITLTPEQKRSLLEVHERFYCQEAFGWNSDAHAHPLCQLLKQNIEDLQTG